MDLGISSQSVIAQNITAILFLATHIFALALRKRKILPNATGNKRAFGIHFTVFRT